MTSTFLKKAPSCFFGWMLCVGELLYRGTTLCMYECMYMLYVCVCVCVLRAFPSRMFIQRYRPLILKSACVYVCVFVCVCVRLSLRVLLRLSLLKTSPSVSLLSGRLELVEPSSCHQVRLPSAFLLVFNSCMYQLYSKPSPSLSIGFTMMLSYYISGRA